LAELRRRSSDRPRTLRTFKGRERDRDAGLASRLARSSRYQIPEGTKIDYKNLPLVQKYVTDRGKIVSRRISGISAKQQRAIATAVKRARFLGLLHVGVRKR